MPLLQGRKEHHLVQAPLGLAPNEEVFVLRFTGEIFRDYE